MQLGRQKYSSRHQAGLQALQAQQCANHIFGGIAVSCWTAAWSDMFRSPDLDFQKLTAVPSLRVCRRSKAVKSDQCVFFYHALPARS